MFPILKNNIRFDSIEASGSRCVRDPRRAVTGSRGRRRDEEEPPRDRLADIPEIAQEPSRRQLRSPAKEVANAPSTIGWSRMLGRGPRSFTQPLYHPIRILPRRRVVSQQCVKSTKRGTISWILSRFRSQIPFGRD